MISRHDNQRLVQDVEGLELLDGGTDSVVQLEQVAQRAVVVESVHLLVDRGGLRHEEEAVLAAALVQDVNRLERHLLEAGQVLGRCISTGWVVLARREVVGEDVAVEPDGQVAPAEDAQSLLVVGGRLQGRLVPANRVALLGELGVEVLAARRARPGNPLLSATAKVGVGAPVVGPGIVGDTVECLVNHRSILGPQAGMRRQGRRGGIRHEGSRNSAPSGALDHSQIWTTHLGREAGEVVAYPNTAQKLNNGLELGVVQWVGGRVGINAAKNTWSAPEHQLPVSWLSTHPRALTELLWPVYRAVAELALSVMYESME